MGEEPAADATGRVRELDELNALESLLEPDFQAIAISAAHVCRAPIALVNLVAEDRQYVKGRAGTDLTGVNPPVPFCDHTVAGCELLEVPDAAADPRFRDTPIVTGPPHIRSYTGVPLITGQGNALGTVCVMDHRPRRLDAAQHQALHTLATHAATLIELHGRAHQTEEVLRRLHALEQLKNQFLRSVNHELRTPLTAIRSYLELAQDGDLDTATTRRFLQGIERSSERMLRLVNALLLMASLKAQTATFTPARIDLAELARQTVERSAPAAELKQLVLNLHAPGPVVVWADAERLGNALLQVLDNAIKFTSRGGAIDVVVVAGPAPGVEIHDTGVGVESEDLRRVFEEFYRTPQAEEQAVEGAGIGLSIVEKIMEMHGGTARMEKERHEGVCVHLTLPPSAATGDRPGSDSSTT
ncbi:GAF domain-containing sensor histidine kinase [Planomonospora parontospora]|uniref:GAF domain-containing sensor histidine kinase n=1 Tax=Planomonospora parontospora TaxID=58119 RepID=UPI00167170AE|nr:GAF domain-containing sensor histidine kinase [Planomonospora parontospora]GGL40443.1 histidine kinase [Planomonospora parontospora subsp. antibiotica]GII18271.1 histidine kinase [Planomonospora parontospora subsp. antibiotica]